MKHNPAFFFFLGGIAMASVAIALGFFSDAKWPFFAIIGVWIVICAIGTIMNKATK